MSLTIETPIHFTRAKAGRKKMTEGPALAPLAPPDRVPRISRLMALAIHFDGLIRQGVVRDYADIARLGGVTRARVTQIMNLLNLAPDLQEALLFGGEFLPHSGLAMNERHTRSISAWLDWPTQRRGIPQRPSADFLHQHPASYLAPLLHVREHPPG